MKKQISVKEQIFVRQFLLFMLNEHQIKRDKDISENCLVLFVIFLVLKIFLFEENIQTLFSQGIIIIINYTKIHKHFEWKDEKKNIIHMMRKNFILCQGKDRDFQIQIHASTSNSNIKYFKSINST